MADLVRVDGVEKKGVLGGLHGVTGPSESVGNRPTEKPWETQTGPQGTVDWSPGNRVLSQPLCSCARLLVLSQPACSCEVDVLNTKYISGRN